MANKFETRREALDNNERVEVSAEETASGATEVLTAEKARQGHRGDGLGRILALSTLGVLAVLFGAYVLFAAGSP